MPCSFIYMKITFKDKSTRWITDKPKHSKRHFSTLRDFQLKLLPQKIHSTCLTWHDLQTSRKITKTPSFITISYLVALVGYGYWKLLIEFGWKSIAFTQPAIFTAAIGNCRAKLGIFRVCFGITFTEVIAFKQNMFISVQLFSCYLLDVFIDNFIEIYYFSCSFFNFWYLIILIPRDIEWKEKFLKKLGKVLGFRID